MSLFTVKELTELIQQGFPDADVEVVDLTGTQDHWQATIISKQFIGKLPLARHRMVYALLGDAMAQRIHALSLITRTPEEHKRVIF